VYLTLVLNCSEKKEDSTASLRSWDILMMRKKARKIKIATLVSSAQKNGKVTSAPMSEPAR